MCRAAGGKVHGGGGASESGDDAGNNDGAWRSARFVIDGFPRNGSNREAWTAAGGRPAAVLELVVPPAVLRSRLLGRGEGRADDTASVVERRLAVAAAEGGGVANWYEAEGLLTRLDGGKKVDEVLDAALAALEGRTTNPQAHPNRPKQPRPTSVAAADIAREQRGWYPPARPPAI
ncbi:hypothetical protein I4F81_001253 [Pyropia yezoensis]|uniref:Uncharacterized protein n=1 Tax=Pyropia yezoensis TaxID=2788 RepID=A0ACC3BLF2_PYRYE|nr:hypothetical protein I4F81_001253 [Neopyropia yezoensis]